MKFGIYVTIQGRDDVPKVPTKERRAREERIGRRLEEVRGLLRENQVIFDRWRAEGILPPEVPRRRV
jgi:hypothetical protein